MSWSAAAAEDMTIGLSISTAKPTPARRAHGRRRQPGRPSVAHRSTVREFHSFLLLRHTMLPSNFARSTRAVLRQVVRAGACGELPTARSAPGKSVQLQPCAAQDAAPPGSSVVKLIFSPSCDAQRMGSAFGHPVPGVSARVRLSRQGSARGRKDDARVLPAGTTRLRPEVLRWRPRSRPDTGARNRLPQADGLFMR